MIERPPPLEIRVSVPDWVRDVIDWDGSYATDEARMRVAIACARENVLRDTGGPFGAAVFDVASSRVVAVGVNLVVPQSNSTLHAEIGAFMMAQAALGT